MLDLQLFGLSQFFFESNSSAVTHPVQVITLQLMFGQYVNAMIINKHLCPLNSTATHVHKIICFCVLMIMDEFNKGKQLLTYSKITNYNY